MQREQSGAEPQDPDGQPAGALRACPVVASQDVFGKKWTFAILRDIVYFGRSRFQEFLAANPGLSDRILAQRLRDLVEEGVLLRSGSGKRVAYSLTDRGEDVKPMLVALFNYGVRHRANEVFEDQMPRSLLQVQPNWGTEFLTSIFKLDAPPVHQFVARFANKTVSD